MQCSTVSARRTLLLDAGLDLVGTAGLRGLTHRAVDAATGLPDGSTSVSYTHLTLPTTPYV